jgi:N-acetylmuramoyl-L-alanine amidase
VGHHRRHSGVLEAARAVIDGGRLGRIVTVNGSATLMGSGTIGNLSLLGNLRPGASPGILTSSNVLFNASGDYFVELKERVNKARKMRADLFVSIHADAYNKPHARGSSVFALSERGATSVVAGWLAKKENEADLIGGVNLDVRDPYVKQVLLDLSQTATINDSIQLGRSVLAEIGGVNTLHKARVEQAGFAVLKAPDIPSILVETAFISNPSEETRLCKPEYQEQLAAAMLQGIRKYFVRNPPLTRDKIAANP